MKYSYIPVPFIEIAKGLENGELKSKDIYCEMKRFTGIHSLKDTSLTLEDCVKAKFYLKKEM